MKKKDLLRFCRYYKGEEECPFKNDHKARLWDYEKVWLKLTLSSYENNDADKDLASMLDDYVSAGLSSFAQSDDTPATLKAILYNRYCHWSQGDVDGFREWYRMRY